jgi:hypothetical protein
MKPLIDVVVLTVMLNMAKAIHLYRLGGAIGLLLGVSASILISKTRRLEAANSDCPSKISRSICNH